MTDKIIGYALTGVKMAFALLGIILIAVIVSNGEDTAAIAGPVGTALGLTYVGIIVCAAGAVLFGVYFFVTDFKRSIPALIGIVAFIVIVLISYGLATDIVDPKLLVDGKVDLGTVRWSGAGLITFYLLLGGAAIAVVAAEVMRFIK